MRGNSDPRINAKTFTLKNFAIQFFIIFIVCGCFIAIYLSMPHTRDDWEYLALSLLAYLIVVSLLVSLVFSRFRRHELILRFKALSGAARQIAKGDFDIRIPPRRTDGKKDEFEVLYEDFNTMAQALESIELLKKDFISNVSHEFKTPIAVIQNYSTILQDGSLTPQERKMYIERIMAASGRLSEMVTSILQISRLENQSVPVRRARYNLSEQLCRCILGFENVLDEKALELETKLDQTICIDSDEGLLDIVWNNLLSNAFKFTQDGGAVQVTLTKTGDAAAVRIADTGCGIAQSGLPHIFDKFYQTDVSHTGKGNGLGLAMVKQILKLLGASVSVESTPGQGSVFTVRLPLQ